jgi:hypothetical protein
MGKPMNLEEVLQDLYDSEINVVISWLWDGVTSAWATS